MSRLVWKNKVVYGELFPFQMKNRDSTCYAYIIPFGGTMFKSSRWSPYAAGILIGLLQIPVFLLLHASIGASGSFGSVTCWLLGQGGEIGCFPFLKNWWQVGFVAGIPFGAFLSRCLSGRTPERVSPIWSKILRTPAFFPRAIMAFCGGFLFMLGARLADGCTSGNGISGIALLSLGSFIVIASMFLSGILTSYLYPKV
jgi:uncharacterized protein